MKLDMRHQDEAVFDDLIERTPGALAQMRARLPPDFPTEVALSIRAGVETASSRLAA